MIKNILLILSHIILIVPNINGQSEIVYISIAGTWSNTNDSARARYEGDNKKIYTHFGEISKVLIFSGSDIIELAELNFTVTETGKIESINLKKSIDAFYDNTLKQMVQSMDGKWVPARRDSSFIKENITIWINIYKEQSLGKTKEQYVKNGMKFYEEKNFKKAIENFDKALIYDKLDIDIMKLKAIALKETGQIEKACETWQLISRYNPLSVTYLLNKYCAD